MYKNINRLFINNGNVYTNFIADSATLKLANAVIKN